MQLLDEASTNEELAVELIQNARPPIVRERFHAVATQRLHNYLASAQSLVEHLVMERYSTRELARITDFVHVARELTDAHIDRLRGRMDKQVDATVRKVQDKMAARQRKLAGIPDRVAAKLNTKQAKLEAKLEKKLGSTRPHD
jgi:hypothetical protein